MDGTSFLTLAGSKARTHSLVYIGFVVMPQFRVLALAWWPRWAMWWALVWGEMERVVWNLWKHLCFQLASHWVCMVYCPLKCCSMIVSKLGACRPSNKSQTSELQVVSLCYRSLHGIEGKSRWWHELVQSGEETEKAAAEARAPKSTAAWTG